MTRLLCFLLMLVASLSVSAIGEYSDLGRSSLAAGKIPVLVDSNLIPRLRNDPTLGGAIGPNEFAVRSFVSKPELRNAIATGSGLRGVPSFIDEIPILSIRPDPNLAIQFRGLLPPGRGLFGDGVIGAEVAPKIRPRSGQIKLWWRGRPIGRASWIVDQG